MKERSPQPDRERCFCPRKTSLRKTLRRVLRIFLSYRRCRPFPSPIRRSTNFWLRGRNGRGRLRFRHIMNILYINNKQKNPYPISLYHCQNKVTGEQRKTFSGKTTAHRFPVRRYFLFRKNYCSTMASFGQVEAQLPQLRQASASITYLPSPSLIALTGQASAQHPQEMQLSVIK